MKSVFDMCIVNAVLDIASVIAAYDATGPEQLSLHVGQLINVRKKSPSGWWEGELQVSCLFLCMNFSLLLSNLQIFGDLWLRQSNPAFSEYHFPSMVHTVCFKN